MDRRTFLKMTGMSSVAFATGCNSHPERHLYTLVRAPADMVTGEATWYASTCRECPSGCGILAKTREGRAVKLEGNPMHPVNQGKLCARGHAALQALYHPDRLAIPLLRTNSGFEKISFEKARTLIQEHARQAAAKGDNRVAMMTEVVGARLMALFETVLSRFNSQRLAIHEPFAYETLKFAHATLFGHPMLPSYHLDQADLVIGFGADFLETWLSPVEYGHKFKTMHALRNGHKGTFIHVAPFQSLTGANADLWVSCRPGTEFIVIMALIHELLKLGRGDELPSVFRRALKRLAVRFQPAQVTQQAQVPLKNWQQLLHQLRIAQHPLILPSATAANGAASAATDLAAVMLNTVLDPKLALFDFQQRHRVEIAHSRDRTYNFWHQITQQSPDLLLLNNVNPRYTMPNLPASEDRLAGKATFVVVFTRTMDETAAMADLIFPVQHPLESWDCYESKTALSATLQPAAGPITACPNMGDLFLDLLPAPSRPAENYREYVLQDLLEQQRNASQMTLLRWIQTGGRFSAITAPPAPPMPSTRSPVNTLADLILTAQTGQAPSLSVQVTPSLRFFDGRHADFPWLPEIPDPITQVAWQSVAWVHPDTLQERNWSDGQTAEIRTANGSVVLPVYGYSGVHPSMVVIPAGQGHTAMGRYARNQGVNPAVLLDTQVDPKSGAPTYLCDITQMVSAGTPTALASVSGSRRQHERKIALSVPLDEAGRRDKTHGLTMNDFPLTLPLPEGYDHTRDLYPPHGHNSYRWGMTVDLDRCTGCSACVAGCYAENNIGIVGEDRIIEGREMTWIRIERYEDPNDATRLIFLPMLCQHCDNAPCESVCPVYAPHHSKEGVNNQIYNRCIGTRFCAQNCPYKVRRFNWFDWQWPEPLNMQLNPDVTVRSKGVMEKCSFCIQRIKAAHNTAKNEKREIRDGEVTPACVQTCPTDALVFGNLMDPNSAVRKKIDDPRAYQVMGYLNTKPAVIYLKKVIKSL